MVVGPLVRPDDFFRGRTTPAFGPPAAIVVAWSVAYALVGIVYSEYLFPVVWEEIASDPEFADLLSNETAPDPTMGIEELPGILGEPLFWHGLTLVAMVIFGLGLWLALAGILYLVSAAFAGEGQFGRLLLFVGWGFLPALGYALLLLGELLYVVVVLGPEAYWDVWLPTELAYPYLSWAVALWVGFIWVYAVKHARSVTLRQAVATTAVPIGAYLLFELWFWFGW